MTDLIQHCRAPTGALTVANRPMDTQNCCNCCGIRGVSMTVLDAQLCMVCAPAFCVDEPEIDALSTLIWLPQIDQGFLSRLLRAAYAARYVQSDPDPIQLAMASRANDLLTELGKLRSDAKRVTGTDQVSTIRRLAPGIPQYNLFLRRKRVSGLRILPLEPWFDMHAEDFKKHITIGE